LHRENGRGYACKVDTAGAVTYYETHAIMPVTTSQQITRYFQQFSNVDVTFTKEVIKAISLLPKQISLKCLGHQWPCVIYSTSLTSAKIIANLNTGLNESLKKANNLVSLRFSFLQPDKTTPLSFFVPAKVTSASPYGKERQGVFLLNLAYTQRPTDDLIEVVGRLVEANTNSSRRSEERLVLTPETMGIMGIRDKGAVFVVDGVSRKCIIRDLSFSGAKVLAMGLAKLLVDKQVVLQIPIAEPEDVLKVPGTIVRFEIVEGREDIAAFAIKFDDATVPMDYKLRINACIKTKKRPAKQPPETT